MRNKQFILIAAVAIVTASCAHSFEAKETQQSAIGFGTWAEQLTKAEARVPGTNTFKVGDTFNIYGYNTINSTEKNIFDGDVVEATSGDPASEWTYSPLRFWDPTASSYTFYAVSPSGILYSAPTDAQSGAYNGLFVSTSRTFNGHNNDNLVATKKEVPNSEYAHPVLMQFNHVASLIDVKIKKDAALPAEAKLKITSASLVNVKSVGAFTVVSYDNSSKKPNTTWTASTLTNYPWEATPPMVVGQKTEYSGTAAGTTTGEDQYLFQNFVLLHQTLNPADNAPTLHIEYKIVTREATTEPAVAEISTEYTANIAIKDFVTTDCTNNQGDSPTYASTSWAPGTHYIYTVTIGANAIVFTAEINNWDVVNGYRYLLQ